MQFEQYLVVAGISKILFHTDHSTVPQKVVTVSVSCFCFQEGLHSMVKVTIDDSEDIHTFVLITISEKFLIFLPHMTF